jgi:cell wall-associated NlpC family hydrolase
MSQVPSPDDLAQLLANADAPTPAASSTPSQPQEPFDWSLVSYALHATMTDNSNGIVPISSLSWEEQAGELATRITAQLPDGELEDGRLLSKLIQLGTPVTVLAALGNQDYQEVARGIVEEVAPSDGSVAGTFEIIAYDPIKSTLDSKVNKFFEWGLTAKDLIVQLLGPPPDGWNVPIDQMDDLMDVAFSGPKVYHQQTIADILKDCVNYVQDQKADVIGNQRMVIRSTGGRISFIRSGGNQPIYWLRQDAGAVIASVRERMSITDLVTKIEISGKNTDVGVPGEIATLDSTEDHFGITRQDILAISQPTTVEDIEKQARQMLNQRGEPRHDRGITAPDVPMLRRYDQIRITAGTMNDHFIVESVQHDEASRLMTLTLGTLRKTPLAGDTATWNLLNPGYIPDQSTGSSTGGDVLVSGGHVTDAQLYALAKAAGFTGQDAITAVAISLAEDPRSDPQARHVNSDKSIDIGLWQINSIHWGNGGIGSENDLVNPQANANAAFKIFSDARARGLNGWQPWSTYPTAYTKYMDRATAASQAPAVPPPSTAAAVTGATVNQTALVTAMNNWVGVPYLYGGTTKAGVDCASFVQHVYADIGVSLPRTSEAQWAMVTKIGSPSIGDLVFFKGTDPNKPADDVSHVGIYVGGGMMASAVSPHVKLDNINSPTWKPHLVGFGRVPA